MKRQLNYFGNFVKKKYGITSFLPQSELKLQKKLRGANVK